MFFLKAYSKAFFKLENSISRQIEEIAFQVLSEQKYNTCDRQLTNPFSIRFNLIGEDDDQRLKYVHEKNLNNKQICTRKRTKYVTHKCTKITKYAQICTNMHVINWEKQASIEVGTGKYLKKKKL